ncbi:MAG: hypothetical protein ABI165_03430 [Bryobacteraceae bacterium]
MLRSIGFPESFAVVVTFSILGLPFAIFYLAGLQGAVARCSPESRTMRPGMLWLMLIPVFNLVWQFVVVTNMSKGLPQNNIIILLSGIPPERIVQLSRKSP